MNIEQFKAKLVCQKKKDMLYNESMYEYRTERRHQRK